MLILAPYQLEQDNSHCRLFQNFIVLSILFKVPCRLVYIIVVIDIFPQPPEFFVSILENFKMKINTVLSQKTPCLKLKRTDEWN